MTANDPPDDDVVTPLPRPEAAVGRALDDNHEPQIRAPIMACVVCGFATDDSFDRTPRHYPLPEEMHRVEAWLAAYGPRDDS